MGLFWRHKPPTDHGGHSGAGSYVRVRSASDWSSLVEQSEAAPVVVFKHSTVCGISDHALRDFQAFLERHPALTAALVDVIRDRAVSNTIASDTGIAHESPQVILIRDQNAVWHGSHWSIDFDELSKELEKAFASIPEGQSRA